MKAFKTEAQTIQNCSKKSAQKECKKAYSTYIHDITSSEQKYNPKKFWSFIENKR